MHFNPFKSLIQNIRNFFLNNISKGKKRNDAEIECLQFGICAVELHSPRPEELFFR